MELYFVGMDENRIDEALRMYVPEEFIDLCVAIAPIIDINVHTVVFYFDVHDDLIIVDGLIDEGYERVWSRWSQSEMIDVLFTTCDINIVMQIFEVMGYDLLDYDESLDFIELVQRHVELSDLNESEVIQWHNVTEALQRRIDHMRVD